MENLINALRKLEESSANTFDCTDLPSSKDLSEKSVEWILLNYIPKQENLKIVSNIKENWFGELVSTPNAPTILLHILQNCKKNNFLLLPVSNVNAMIQQALKAFLPSDYAQIQDYCHDNHLFNLECTKLPVSQKELFKACAAYPYLAGFARITYLVAQESMSNFTQDSDAIRIMKQYLTAKARVHKSIAKIQTPIVPCKDPVFDWLPLELVNSIFSLLDPKTLSVVGNVCKLWSELSRNGALWRNFIENQVLSENKNLRDPLLGYSDKELKEMYLKWFVPYWNEAEHLKKFQWVEIAISAIDGSNFKEISIFLDVIGITSDIIHNTSTKYVPQQRLLKAQQRLYSVLIKMCTACTDEMSLTKLESILFSLVNSETSDYHPVLFEQITKTKNYQRFIPNANKLLKIMCLKHKHSKARDVVDWISRDPEFLNELINNDAVEGIDKPQSVLVYLLEELDAVLPSETVKTSVNAKRVASFLSKMPDIWLKNSLSSFVLRRPKNNFFIPELLKQLQELLDPKLASYKALHEALMRYDDAELHKKLKLHTEPEEEEENIMDDNSRKSCNIS